MRLKAREQVKDYSPLPFFSHYALFVPHCKDFHPFRCTKYSPPLHQSLQQPNNLPLAPSTGEYGLPGGGHSENAAHVGPRGSLGCLGKGVCTRKGGMGCRRHSSLTLRSSHSMGRIMARERSDLCL